ncbi:GNAT family N-acetyltransferase [Pseudolysinimonas sp.]|jgi:ribosomal protein S18 acetylase RimI-like enzyme|uniref:GNAT family N-acetyltransferase n=1 Tax=Pseudolysinimonas sp. TaxID=2680009 RepID=UPI0037831165
MVLELRPARADDIPRIAEIWRPAWLDGHLGGVPDELVRIRTPENFVVRATAIQPHTTLAVVDGATVGFVAVAGNEIDQLFVDASARGLGIADLLLRAGEDAIAAAGHPEAWLAVVATNARARRFYERNGWSDGGSFLYATDGDDGLLDVSCQRYEKSLTPTPAG